MFKLITTGYFYADGGAMFGAIPKVSWSRSYPVDGRNLCLLAMHTGVVRTSDGHVIIIDPGVGQDCLNDTPAIYYRFHDTKDLCEELRQTGIAPQDVTDVIFTHLHFDHCGGAVRRNASGVAQPAFPNAAHWVSRPQYENEQNPHPLEATSFLPQNTEVLEKAGLLHLVEAAATPFDSLQIRLYDGHTLGQIAARIKAPTSAPTSTDGEETTIIFPGDIIPLASHVIPERISAYDLYPTRSYDGKIEILKQASPDNDLFIFYHDAYTPFSTLRKNTPRRYHP
jgi:glyoxylase-like metal-dependent hydrolase (beta-lactamase superfamily II)